MGRAGRLGTQAVGTCRKQRQERDGGPNMGTGSTEGSDRERQEREDRGRLAQGQGRFEPMGRGPMKSKGPKVPE